MDLGKASLIHQNDSNNDYETESWNDPAMKVYKILT